MSKPKSAKTNVAPGLYLFAVKTIGDIGTQTVKGFESEEEEEKKQLIMVVECLEESTKGKIVNLSKWVTNSSSPRSWGGKLMKALGLNPATSDWDDVLNKPFQAPVEHTEGGNAKIKDPIATKKGTKAPKGFMTTLSCYLDESFDNEAFEAMPEFIQNQMIKSPEFEAIDAKRKKGKATTTSKAKAAKKK